MYVLSYHSIVLSTICCLVLKMKNKDEKVVPSCSEAGAGLDQEFETRSWLHFVRA